MDHQGLNERNDMLSKKITDAVCSIIEEKTGHKVKTIPMLQNNGIPATGIMLEDSSLTPILCIEDVHQQLRKRKIKPTVYNLADFIASALEEEADDPAILSVKEKMLNAVYPRLINYKLNEPVLTFGPYRRFMDMAMVYYVDVDKERCTRLNEGNVKKAGVTEEELYNAAIANTQKLDFVSYTLDELIRKFQKMSITADQFRQFDGVDMTYVTNKEHWYGAHAMLSQDTLGTIADKKGCDLMILPASVHEIIVVPEDAGRSGSDLQKMVKQANLSLIGKVEKLTDSVYRFERESRKTRIDTVELFADPQ